MSMEWKVDSKQIRKYEKEWGLNGQMVSMLMLNKYQVYESKEDVVSAMQW